MQARFVRPLKSTIGYDIEKTISVDVLHAYTDYSIRDGFWTMTAYIGRNTACPVMALW